jgi:GT2 family glycosyltransferase
MDSILGIVAADRSYDLAIKDFQSGVLISRPRNLLVGAFLVQPQFTHFLWVDTDIVFTPEDVEALLEAKKPIVSGLYFGRDIDTEVWPVALKWDKDEQKFLRYRGKLEGDRPIRMGAVGMGFCLIEREVLEKLETSDLWPYAEIEYGKGSLSEDVTFCMRAREKGFEAFVLPSARVGHVKQMIV